MFSKRKFFNAKGFSLIELMVVVAIIGILASIGIPQYSKFQAKTRQSEAKGALATLYTSEMSFSGEWNQYTKDLRNIGFGVSGNRLRYITGFDPLAACAGYSVAGGAPAEVAGAAANFTNTFSCGANVNVVSPSQAQNWQLPGGITVSAAHQCTAIAAATVYAPVAATLAASSCDSTPGTQTFTAAAMGDPNANVDVAATGTFKDGWTINQLKRLSNNNPGIQ